MKTKLLLAGCLLIASLAIAQAASAHSRPIRFDPGPGTVLTSAPPRITGWFNADLRRDPSWNFLQVTDEQKNRVDVGDIILSANRRQMSIDLRPNLPNGRYLVTWRSWDDVDGRIFGDCFTFFVGQSAADAAVAANYRMDGGADCQRIDVQASEGTPVPGVTVTPVPEGPDTSLGGTASPGTDDDGDSGGVPVWLLAVTGGLGLVAGAVGRQLLGGSAKS